MRKYTDAVDLKDTLKSFELNLANNCNRACGFCPHSLDTYEYKQGLMSLDTVRTITQRLLEYGYKNRVSICGFGEPTVNKNLSKIINCLREVNGFLELTSNGDLLTVDNINLWFDNGLDLLNISIYDYETELTVTELLTKTLPRDKFIIRRRYLDTSNLVNRIDIIRKIGDVIHNNCYIPSYKMIVDYDGTVLLCCNDWTRNINFGNILYTDLETIWFENMRDKRMNLLMGDRSTDACKTCDVNGTIAGSGTAELFKQHYKL